eukprot:XP_001695147.1 predicted protein [Chlamydomonas reinhardtii]
MAYPTGSGSSQAQGGAEGPDKDNANRVANNNNQQQANTHANPTIISKARSALVGIMGKVSASFYSFKSAAAEGAATKPTAAAAAAAQPYTTAVMMGMPQPPPFAQQPMTVNSSALQPPPFIPPPLAQSNEKPQPLYAAGMPAAIPPQFPAAPHAGGGGNPLSLISSRRTWRARNEAAR